MKQTMINYSKQPARNDEFYTPKYAIKPLLKYLKPKSRIWCPFDKEESNYVKVLAKYGHKVGYSHIENNQDFFNIEINKERKIDYIISNPPFSIKDKVLKKLFELNLPFCMLLPLTTLEGINRSKLFQKHGIELLIFDKRIGFMKDKNNIWFNTSYFCFKVLPKQLIFESLEKDKND